METVWLIVEKQQESVHDQCMLMRIGIEQTESELDRDEIAARCQLESYTLLEVVRSEDEVESYRKTWRNQSVRDYTKIINKLSNMELVHDRFFLAYLDQEVTVIPRIYQVHKSDYEKLKDAFPSVRLATDEEADLTDPFTSCFIATDYQKIIGLNLSTLRVLDRPDGIKEDRYYDLCCRFDESQELLDELRFHCINLAQETEFTNKQKAIEVAKQLFNEEAEETVDKLISFFRAIELGEVPELPTLPSVQYNVIDEIDYGVEQVNIEYL